MRGCDRGWWEERAGGEGESDSQGDKILGIQIYNGNITPASHNGALTSHFMNGLHMVFSQRSLSSIRTLNFLSINFEIFYSVTSSNHNSKGTLSRNLSEHGLHLHQTIETVSQKFEFCSGRGKGLTNYSCPREVSEWPRSRVQQWLVSAQTKPLSDTQLMSLSHYYRKYFSQITQLDKYLQSTLIIIHYIA